MQSSGLLIHVSDDSIPDASCANIVVSSLTASIFHVCGLTLFGKKKKKKRKMERKGEKKSNLQHVTH